MAVRESATGAWVALPQLDGPDPTFMNHSGVKRLDVDPSAGAVKKKVSSVGRGAPHIKFSTERRLPSETNESKLFADIDGIFTVPVDSDTSVIGHDFLDARKVIIDRDHTQILLLSLPYD